MPQSYHDSRSRAGSRREDPRDLLEHDAHRLAHDERRVAVVRRLLKVDDREGTARAQCLAGEAGDRPDLERRSEDDEQAGLLAESSGSRHRALGKLFAEHDDPGLQDRIARAAQRHAPVSKLRQHPGQRRDGTAREAVEATHRAVQLDHVGASAT
jgi:hypothetical protein